MNLNDSPKLLVLVSVLISLQTLLGLNTLQRLWLLDMAIQIEYQFHNKLSLE